VCDGINLKKGRGGKISKITVKRSGCNSSKDGGRLSDWGQQTRKVKRRKPNGIVTLGGAKTEEELTAPTRVQSEW